VIHLTEEILKKYPSDYVYWMEDDFFSCSYSIVELIRTIAVLEMRRPNACSLSTSHGMNGLLLARNDTINFVQYAKEFSHKLPIDNILQRMIYFPPLYPLELKIFCKPNRVSFFYKNVSFFHLFKFFRICWSTLEVLQLLTKEMLQILE
jgi:hypothetical protein